MEHQKRILNSDARFKIACCGRQIGKTTLCLIAVVSGHGTDHNLRGLIQGAKILWVAPTYKILTGIWRELKKSIGDAGKISEVEHRIELPTGGSVTLLSAEGGLSIRGGNYDAVVVDEAAYIDEAIWTAVVLPTMATKTDFWCIFASTPAGVNWFKQRFDDAILPQNKGKWERWQLPSIISPLVNQEILDQARAESTDAVFRQEWQAEFVTEEGALLKEQDIRYLDKHVEANGIYYVLNTDNGPKTVQSTQLRIFQTVDLAYTTKATSDYTVISTFGVDEHNDILCLDVFREKFSGADHLDALRAQNAKWHPSFIYIEVVAAQRALYDQAVRAGLPVREFSPSGSDKVARFMPILSRFQNHTVYLNRAEPWFTDLKKELTAFPLAPHDDMVDTFSIIGLQVTQQAGTITARVVQMR